MHSASKMLKGAKQDFVTTGVGYVILQNYQERLERHPWSIVVSSVLT